MLYYEANKKSFSIHDETCPDLKGIIADVLDENLKTFIEGTLTLKELKDSIYDDLTSAIPDEVTVPLRESFISYIQDVETEIENLKDKIDELEYQLAHN